MTDAPPPHRASRRGRARRSALRAYTIVELVMSLSVLAIGVSGVIAMQRVTVSANRHAKNLMLATRIAEAWADQLTADATLWTYQNGLSTLSRTAWLQKANTAGIVDWYVPAYSADRLFGPGFSALAAPVDHTKLPKQVQFCTHLRLTFVRDETASGIGAADGIIRAQVRVFWRRDDNADLLGGTVEPKPDDLCAVDGPTLATNLDSFHLVYLTTAVHEANKGRI